MHAIRQSLRSIVDRIGELSPSARLLIGSLAVILVMAMFLVAQYTARPALAALPLNGDTEAVAAAARWLTERGIEHEERGETLYVPADRRHAILAQLTEGNVVNARSIDFTTLIEQDSPFRSQDQSYKLWLTAKMNELSRIISNFSGVKRATVVISDEQRRGLGLGASHRPPSATVTVEMRSGEMSQELVDAVAATVVGGHAGLKIENVRITDASAGRQRHARNSEELAAGAYLEHQISTERAVRERIESILWFIPDVVVSVNAQVVTYEEERHAESFTDPVIGPTAERNSTVTSTGPAVGGEPGIRTNTGVSVPLIASRGASYSSEESEARLAPRFPSRQSVVRDRKGFPTKINATVGIPRSYVSFLVQRETGQDNPDAAAIAAREQSLIEQVQNLVEPLIDTDAVENGQKGRVVVSVITPAPAALDPDGTPMVPASSGGWSAGTLNDTLVRTVALGTLGLISLAMMLLMVRKAQGSEPLPTAAELAGIPPALRTEDTDLVGEADEATPALDGMELDDESLRRQQMLRQINEMVSRAPGDAAVVLRRWMRGES